MVTASHNAEADNGVKLADPSGGMLCMAWERAADELAAAEDTPQLLAIVARLVVEHAIDITHPSHAVQVLLVRRSTHLAPPPLLQVGFHNPKASAQKLTHTHVRSLIPPVTGGSRLMLRTDNSPLVAKDVQPQSASTVVRRGELIGTHGAVQGRDTRCSSPGLVAVAAQGLAAVGVRVLHLNLVTTPQLHFLVRACNRGEPYTEAAYYSTLAGGYRSLVRGGVGRHAGALVLDAANGVGGPKWRALVAGLELGVEVEVRNDGQGRLNERVGADFVQKEQKPPLGFAVPADTGCRYGLVSPRPRLVSQGAPKVRSRARGAWFRTRRRTERRAPPATRLTRLQKAYMVEILSAKDPRRFWTAPTLNLGLVGLTAALANRTTGRCPALRGLHAGWCGKQMCEPGW
jgi:hypothetical protein